MEAVLKEIEALYVSLVPETLNELDSSDELYAAFIPYFGWTMYAEEQAEAGREIFLLKTEYFEECELKEPDPGKLGYNTYCWGAFIDNCGIVEVESKELHQCLLKWCEHQIENDDSILNIEYMKKIGGCLANACRKLNGFSWDPNRFNADFVVFTDCMADEVHEHNLKHCVSDEWLKKQKSTGLFETYYTID